MADPVPTPAHPVRSTETYRSALITMLGAMHAARMAADRLADLVPDDVDDEYFPEAYEFQGLSWSLMNLMTGFHTDAGMDVKDQAERLAEQVVRWRNKGMV